MKKIILGLTVIFSGYAWGVLLDLPEVLNNHPRIKVWFHIEESIPAMIIADASHLKQENNFKGFMVHPVMETEILSRVSTWEQIYWEKNYDDLMGKVYFSITTQDNQGIRTSVHKSDIYKFSDVQYILNNHIIIEIR